MSKNRGLLELLLIAVIVFCGAVIVWAMTVAPVQVIGARDGMYCRVERGAVSILAIANREIHLPGRQDDQSAIGQHAVRSSQTSRR
jgi:hypothetical protein